MTHRSRTPSTRGPRPRSRHHHGDRPFRSAPLFELTAEEVMLDLDPGWPSARTRGQA